MAIGYNEYKRTFGFDEYNQTYRKLEREKDDAIRHIKEYERQFKDNGKLSSGDRNMLKSWEQELKEIEQNLTTMRREAKIDRTR